MFRLYDWMCSRCAHTHEAVISLAQGSDPPAQETLRCPRCKRDTPHARMMPLPAPYLGERPMSPQVFGGKRDTMGYEPAPPPPGESATRAEVADWAKRKRAVRARNAAKRKRAASGADFRANPLPGDPNWRRD